MNEQRARRHELESQYRDANDEEAALLHQHKQAHATAMLQSEQKTEGLRQAEAVLAVGTIALKLRLAIGLRRSAKEALNGCHDDADTLQAAFHAYNRELKMDMDLATHGESR